MDLGEDAGFDVLYAAVGPRLWRSILAYTGGRRDLTDDIVAEAFARTLAASDVRDPEPYLYRVAFRLAAQELRRAPTFETLPETPVSDDPGLIELFGTLRELSAGQRAAVFLRYQADLPVEQVAKLMGTSSGVVRIHLFRARKKLARLLGGADDE
ncbi:MAG: sigma-70 family RNA polymerase sigma factor [Actinomycetota bacterium]